MTNPTEVFRVIPHLVVNDGAAALDFYTKAFDATEEMRMPTPDGRLMHAAISLGGNMVMLMDEFPEMGGKSPKTLGGSPVTIHLMVKNADDAIARAEAAGAKVLMPAQDQFWGDRYGVVEDPFGHTWSLAHTVKQLSGEEMKAAAEKMAAG